ncbi:YcjX family protein, partial [Escherichia sp. HC-CC]
NRLADIAAAWTDYLHHCKQQGLHFIQPGRFVLPGDMAGAPALQFFPWPDVDAWGESKLEALLIPERLTGQTSGNFARINSE